MIGAVLRTTYVTHASARPFNNEIGVPLTLLGAPDGAEMLVLELGGLYTPSGMVEAKLSARGAHQIVNAAAAAAVGFVCGVATADVGHALEQAVLSPLRMSLSRNGRGVCILDDSYNANPVSVEAALRSLVALPAKRRVAVLGVMAELGPSEDAEHRQVANLAQDMGVEVFAVDAPQYGVECVGMDRIADRLSDLGDGDAVLVKGSRVAGMERVAAMLREG